MKKVNFSDLTVIEYPIILGDNPACTDGCPITIDWIPIGGYKHSLDLYEYTNKKTSKSKIYIPVQQRTQILLEAGFAPEEIVQQIIEVTEIRCQRQESIRQYSSHDKHFTTFGKLSKNFMLSVANLGSTIGGHRTRPSNSKKIKIAQSA